MLISCPECSAKFILKIDKLKDGAKLKCSKCDHVWRNEDSTADDTQDKGAPQIQKDEPSDSQSSEVAKVSQNNPPKNTHEDIFVRSKARRKSLKIISRITSLLLFFAFSAFAGGAIFIKQDAIIEKFPMTKPLYKKLNTKFNSGRKASIKISGLQFKIMKNEKGRPSAQFKIALLNDSSHESYLDSVVLSLYDKDKYHISSIEIPVAEQLMPQQEKIIENVAQGLSPTLRYIGVDNNQNPSMSRDEIFEIEHQKMHNKQEVAKKKQENHNMSQDQSKAHQKQEAVKEKTESHDMSQVPSQKTESHDMSQVPSQGIHKKEMVKNNANDDHQTNHKMSHESDKSKPRQISQSSQTEAAASIKKHMGHKEQSSLHKKLSKTSLKGSDVIMKKHNAISKFESNIDPKLNSTQKSAKFDAISRMKSKPQKHNAQQATKRVK